MAHLGIDGVLQFAYVENLTRCFCNATLTVAAIHDYRERIGKLPARLLDVPLLADSVLALDPFSGRSLVYRRNRRHSFMLYGVGADQADSGGRHNEFGRGSGDWVFWPP